MRASRERELCAALFAEQREHTDGLSTGLQQRAGENAIRNGTAAVRVEAVDDHGLGTRLRHRQQLSMSARNELVIR